jgi:monoamine oxidase
MRRNPSIRSKAQLTSATAQSERESQRKVIEKGLPKTTSPRNVAVVGAGMSGLISALLLAEAGNHVTLFEASMRVGGRVKTVREPFTDGLYCEAGAMRLPTFYQLTLDYIHKLGLPLNPFLNNDAAGNEFIFVNGVKMRRSEYVAKNGKGLNYPLKPREEGKQAETLLTDALSLISNYVGQASLDGYEHNRWAQVVEKFGESTVREYLKAQTFYSEGAIEMVEVLMDLESRTDQALIQQIVEINDHGPTVQYYEITGGFDKFPLAFLPLLKAAGVEIHFNHRLVKVDQGGPEPGVTLQFEPYDAGLAGHRQLSSFAADDVILTIPFPGMRYVRVEPMLSHNKRKAIRELHYDAATKIMLQFKSRFWELKDEIYGGSTTTDLPSRFIYYPSHGFGETGGGVVLTSYTWGDEARGWDALSDEHKIQSTLNDMARIHGDYIRDEFVVGVVQSWATDRFSYGEAAMFYGGELEELQPYIPATEGNIYFAGEHTSLKHAWIEGAIDSAIRVALEISGLPPG